MIATQLDLVAPPGRVPRGTQLAGFRILGPPQPWARATPHVNPRTGQLLGQVFTGPYGDWRTQAIRAIAAQWAGRESIRVPIAVQVVAVQERPDGPPTRVIDGCKTPYPWSWEAGRIPSLDLGDVDNFAKGVLDVLQQVPKPLGMEVSLTPVLADDRLVVDLRATRVYAAVGEQACTEVRLWSAA